jgi:hypothetical protein
MSSSSGAPLPETEQPPLTLLGTGDTNAPRGEPPPILEGPGCSPSDTKDATAAEASVRHSCTFLIDCLVVLELTLLDRSLLLRELLSLSELSDLVGRLSTLRLLDLGV